MDENAFRPPIEGPGASTADQLSYLLSPGFLDACGKSMFKKDQILLVIRRFDPPAQHDKTMLQVADGSRPIDAAQNVFYEGKIITASALVNHSGDLRGRLIKVLDGTFAIAGAKKYPLVQNLEVLNKKIDFFLFKFANHPTCNSLSGEALAANASLPRNDSNAAYNSGPISSNNGNTPVRYPSNIPPEQAQQKGMTGGLQQNFNSNYQPNMTADSVPNMAANQQHSMTINSHQSMNYNAHPSTPGSLHQPVIGNAQQQAMMGHGLPPATVVNQQPYMGVNAQLYPGHGAQQQASMGLSAHSNSGMQQAIAGNYGMSSLETYTSTARVNQPTHAATNQPSSPMKESSYQDSSVYNPGNIASTTCKPNSTPGFTEQKSEVPDSYGPQRHKKEQDLRSAPYKTTSAGPVARQSTGVSMPIKNLTQYASRWIFKARIVHKANIRTFTNPRGEGKLFNIDVIDRDGGQIRATFFGKAVDKWYDYLQEGKVYEFSKGVITPRNQRFNELPHPCEIKFDENSLIQFIEDDFAIPATPKANYVKISEIQNKSVGDIVDILAILMSAKDVSTIVQRSSGQERVKRDLTFTDDSQVSINMTIWGDQATKYNNNYLASNPVVSIRGAKVGDFMGKKLDSISSTKLEWEPKIPEANFLLQWWQTKGRSTVVEPIRDANVTTEGFKSLNEIHMETIHPHPDTNVEKGLFFDTQCIIEYVPCERYYWVACPSCNRKVIEEKDELGNTASFTCNSCSKTVEPEYRWLLTLSLIDFSGTLKCKAMAQHGQSVMGFVDITAQELMKLYQQSSHDSKGRSFRDIFSEINLTEWSFKIGARVETYNDESQTNYRIIKATPLERNLKNEMANRLKWIHAKLGH